MFWWPHYTFRLDLISDDGTTYHYSPEQFFVAEVPHLQLPFVHDHAPISGTARSPYLTRGRRPLFITVLFTTSCSSTAVIPFPAAGPSCTSRVVFMQPPRMLLITAACCSAQRARVFSGAHEPVHRTRSITHSGVLLCFSRSNVIHVPKRADRKVVEVAGVKLEAGSTMLTVAWMQRKCK